MTADETQPGRHLPWCRVHDTWYTTRSHVGLDGVALNIGPRLMSLANASPERGALLDAASRPISLAVLAREVRFPVSQVRRALEQLAACGTLEVRPDGSYVFPNFRRWQETPSAERQRRRRASVDPSPSVTEGVTESVTSGVTVTRTVTATVTPRGQRTEDRSLLTTFGEGAIENVAPSPPTVASIRLQGGRTWPVTEAHLERWSVEFRALDVLAEVRRAETWTVGAAESRRPKSSGGAFITRWLKRALNDAAERAVRSPQFASRLTPAERQIAETRDMVEKLRARGTGAPDHDDEPPTQGALVLQHHRADLVRR